MVERPVEPLVTLLRRSAQGIVDELVDSLRAAGFRDIAAAHHPVFFNLDPGGTRLTELATRAGMTHQSMGELVCALVDLGYATRAADPNDGRVKLVVLTARGRRAVSGARKEVQAIERRWIEQLRAAGLRGDLRSALAVVLAAEPRASQSPSVTTPSR